MSAVELVGVKILLAHLKALEMRMRRLVLDSSESRGRPVKLPEKINKMFLPKNLGFIDVLSTQIRFWTLFSFRQDQYLN